MEKKLWHIESLWDEALQGASQKTTTPPIKKSEYFEIDDEYRPQISDAPVHRDDDGAYFGMREPLLIHREKPIFIVDNHNKALFAFFELKEELQKVLPVINIDAHPDDREVNFEVREITKENIEDMYRQSQISDFLDIAKKGGIIKNVENIVTSIEFMGFILPGEEYILSLDIDIFGPEGEYVDLEKRIKVIDQAWQGASAIVIATSPGFIEQDYAHEIIKILIKRTMV